MAAHPDTLAPRLLLAQHYLANGKPQEVSGLLGSLDAVQRRTPAVLRLQTAAYLATGQYEQARQSIAPLLEDNEDQPALFHYAARAAAGTGDQVEAREFLERALEIDPEFLPSLLSLARLDMAENQSESYPESLEKLLVLAPDTPEVKQLQAIMAFRGGDAAGAAELAGQAFALAPTEYNLLRWVNYLAPAGQEERANSLLREWLKQHPDSTRARLALGIAMGLDGDSGASIAQYREILELNPDDFVALNNLAWELRDSDPTAALEFARRAVQLRPESPAALDTLAVIEYKAGDLNAAQRSIRKAVEMAPDEPSLMYHNAMIEAARGQDAQAREMLTELLSRGVDFPERGDAEELLASLK
jgi:Flp pilus assembly protein TadD